MTRDQIKGVMDAAKKVAKALEELPYRKACDGLRELETVCALVAEQLPGHEYAECGHCEEAKGVDEMVDCGDENMCTQCASRYDTAVQ